MMMEIAGIQLVDGDAFEGYTNWVGEEELKNKNTLKITARPSNGKQYRYAENKNIEQMLYDIELRDIDNDIVFDPSSKVELALFELNKAKAEWVIDIVRKLQSPDKIRAKLKKTKWVISRLAEPYPPDMHDQQLDEDLQA
ncbi:hypothetical protein HS096_07055 [candidate division WWE3 bacterium]|uniref:Uncharacterized protein n=1 Tax=candidate division WWE3 bacterium TaxID=2053526 RepID=A0A928Y7C9_UNCKA|nr:hypothetical protein [candidate division WWE3 bacterium]